MTSSTEKQIITVRILPNISRSEGNQRMKFGQSIEGNVKNIFFENQAKNEPKRLVPGLSLVFKKALNEALASFTFEKIQNNIIEAAT